MGVTITGQVALGIGPPGSISGNTPIPPTPYSINYLVIAGGGGGGGSAPTPGSPTTRGKGGRGGPGTIIITVPNAVYPSVSAPGAAVSTPGSAPGYTVLTYTAASLLTPSTFTYTA